LPELFEATRRTRRINIAKPPSELRPRFTVDRSDVRSAVSRLRVID
jgi:hypothetical protein